MNRPISIPVAVRRMLTIVERLRRAYPNKRFTLDGRLVGDIGEILVAEAYDLRLLEGLIKHHDAEARDGRLVQIKATMQRWLTFPVDHVPRHYLGILIYPDGRFSEIFNGPGSAARNAIARRRPTKTNLHSIPLSTLCKLSGLVPGSKRVRLRPGAKVKPVPLRAR